MRALGYTDGKDVVIDERFMVDRYEALPEAAAAMLREKVSVIVVYGSTAAQAAHKTAPNTAIVVASGGDPVKLGAAKSLAHPGGNLTGLTSISSDLSGKRLELLKEILPGVQRMAVVLYPGSPAEQDSLQQYRVAAQALNVTVLPIEIRNPAEIGPAIARIGETGAQAAIVVGSTMFSAYRKEVLTAMNKHRLAAMYPNASFVEDGGLVAYSTNIAQLFFRAASYVDKILKGAKPGDLPIEQPSKLELVVNLKTAKALGITIPQSVLVRADRLID
jgi:ABC-type uncharacterized transport system substrate-binding protein